MKPFPSLFFGITLGCLSMGCQRSAPSTDTDIPNDSPWFKDVTDEVGLDFVHDAGPTDDTYFMPQIVGSGAALFDFDGDGRLDLYLLNNGGPRGKPNALFRQLPDGTFQDVSKGSGLDFSGYCMGVAVGDVNNDGRPDVLVTGFGWVRLLLNNGNGTFVDITQEAGLDNPGWGASAAFVDFDRDGWLDLVLVNYVDYDRSWPCSAPDGRRDYCSPNQFTGAVTRLYRNQGRLKKGRVAFENVTAKSGLVQRPGPGLGVVCADFDGDGWPDIFVANDGRPNHLWINQRDGTFKEEAVVRGVATNGMGQAQAGMGVALGDIDGDGLFDLFVTHLGVETHTLWKQGPRGLFRDATAGAGLASSHSRGTGWGTALADFDHDGAVDLVVVNGRVTRGTSETGHHSFWARYAERNQMFAGDGQGQFRERSELEGPLCGTPGVSRALVVGDFNNDGALDLLVTTVAGKARMYRNVAPQRGHWLMVRALDPVARRDAYGSEVTIEAGGRRRVGMVNPGQSYLCSGDPRVHFGLGQAANVDSIEVYWPDGSRETFPGGAVDRVVELRKGSGKRTRQGGSR